MATISVLGNSQSTGAVELSYHPSCVCVCMYVCMYVCIYIYTSNSQNKEKNVFCCCPDWHFRSKTRKRIER